MDSQKQLKHFIRNAGSSLEIWKSIVGQKITHKSNGTGTIIGIEKNNDTIYVKVQFRAQIAGKYLGDTLLKHFTHLTFPREVEKALKTDHVNKGDFDRAIVNRNNVIQLNPDSTKEHINQGIIYYNQGIAYYNKGEYDRAIEYYNKAIKLKPNYAEAYNNRGLAYHKKGDFDRAVENYNKALKLKPDYTKADKNRIAAYRGQNRNSNKKYLLNQLSNLVAQPSIDPSNADTFDKIYGRLMKMNRKRKLSEQTIQEMNEYRQKLMVGIWNFQKEDLLNQLRDLASQPSINPSTLNTFNKIYGRLMKMNQERKLSEQTIQEMNEYRQKLMVGIWNFQKEDLLNRLRNLASQPSINPSTLNTFDAKYKQLMEMHPEQNLLEQTSQEIKGYRQKLIDRIQSSLINQLRNLASQPSIDPSTLNTFDAKYKQLMEMHPEQNLLEQTSQEIKGYRQKLIDRIQSSLINRLRNLASQPSIDPSTLNTFDAKYKQLMEMDQQQALPKEIIQKINGYRQKLIDRMRFSDLSEKAMNPNVRVRFPLPYLNAHDLQLVEKWWHRPLNDLDRMSLIKCKSTNWDLGRLLSARAAEKVAVDFYQNYGKTVADISITQIYENSTSDWKDYDLNVAGHPIDVKNSRKSQNSEDRYTEHCIPTFKHSRANQEVIIAGVFSPFLWVFELLDEPTEPHEDAEIQFLGETTRAKQEALKTEFGRLVHFERPNSAISYFLPPWMFDYPKYVYTERDEVLKELRDFPNFAFLKGATFEFNLIPVAIAIGIDLTEILDNGVLAPWEWSFLNQLRNRIEKYGLSLPFLFLTILEHFLDMVASLKTAPDFEPDKYRKFFFCEAFDKPLGIYDPLKTIDALIDALSILWTAEKGLIRQFCTFRLKSFNILQGKSDPNDRLWTTLIAYCGGRLPKDGSACGKNPLILGESELCECRRLICPECGFCCQTCKGATDTWGIY